MPNENEELQATANDLIQTGRILRKAANSFDDEAGAILGGKASLRNNSPFIDLSPDPRGFAVNELTSLFDGHHASLADDAQRFLELAYFADMVRFHLAWTKHFADTTGDGLASFGNAAKVIGNQYDESDHLADKQLNKLDKVLLGQLQGTEMILGEYHEINTASGPPASAAPPPSLAAPQPPAATDWESMEFHQIVYLIMGIHNQEVGELGHRFDLMGALLAAYERSLSNFVLGLSSWQGRAATAYRQHSDHATGAMHQWVVGLPERHKTITGADGATTAIRVAQETIQAAIAQLRKELKRWQEVWDETQLEYDKWLEEARKGTYQFGDTVNWPGRFEGIKAGIEGTKDDAKAKGVEAGITLAAALVKAAPWKVPGAWQGMRGLTERPRKFTQPVVDPPGGTQGVTPPKIKPIDDGKALLHRLEMQIKQDQKRINDLLKQLEAARKKAIEQQQQQQQQQQQPPPGAQQQPPPGMGAVTPPLMPTIPPVSTTRPTTSPWAGTPWTPALGGGVGSLTGRSGPSASDDAVLNTATSNTLLGRDGLSEAGGGGGGGGDGDGSPGIPFLPPMMPPMGGAGGSGGGGQPRSVRRSGGPRLVQDDREGSQAITGRGRDDKRAKPKIVELETESWTSEPQTAEVEETKPTAPGRVLGN